MIDERKEFQCYTTFPTYRTESKKDTAFLNCISLQILKKGAGFLRVLTIVARGYLHKDELPDVEHARRALCAWCSIPAEKEEEWQFDTNFAELHTEFPELVDEQGNGWLVRHVNNIAAFVESSPKPGVKWIGFLLSWVMHGLYDFSLSQEFIAINDNLMIVALLLAVMDIVLVLLLIGFARKAKKQPLYIEPLPETIGKERK